MRVKYKVKPLIKNKMILDHFVMVRIHVRQPLLPSVRGEPRGT